MKSQYATTTIMCLQVNNMYLIKTNLRGMSKMAVYNKYPVTLLVEHLCITGINDVYDYKTRNF